MMNATIFQETTPEKKYVKPALKWPATLFSYIFHPVFVPIYVIAFLVYLHPSYFAGFSARNKLQTIFISIYNMVFFPLFTVLLLKGVGFIESIYLRTRKDRIIPYMASGIFYFWAYTIFHKQGSYPPIMGAFSLGVFFAASAGLIANIYFKVSMHAMGMGGWLGIFLVILQSNSMLMTWPLAAVILLTGIVCTSRFIVSDHTQKEVYLGLVIGMLCQFVAAMI